MKTPEALAFESNVTAARPLPFGRWAL